MRWERLLGALKIRLRCKGMENGCINRYLIVTNMYNREDLFNNFNVNMDRYIKKEKRDILIDTL